MIKNWTIGSDAEMFLVSRKDNSVFPVCGLVGGTKKKPKPMGTGGYFIQEDNILLEFNIPVCRTPVDFVFAIQTGVARAKKLLPKGLEAIAMASGKLDAAFLDIPQACVFGCEPDFNAWEHNVNSRPHCDDPHLRTAAAHIHLGWENPNDADRHAVIQAADLFAGIPSIFEDKDTERRKLYGRAGAFRMKEYGVEHRVLSNYWIDMGANKIGSIYNRYKQAIDFVNKEKTIPGNHAKMIQEAINTNNKKIASELVDTYHLT